MYTIAFFTWLGRKLRLVLRDTAYFTLIVGFLLTLPLLFNGSAMADATVQVLHVDPMVAYLVNVGVGGATA